MYCPFGKCVPDGSKTTNNNEMKHLVKLSLLAFLLLANLVNGQAAGQWTPINLNPSKYILSLNFLNDNLGYAMVQENPGNILTLEKTTDGGQTWSTISLPAGGPEFQDLHFHADGSGVVVFRDLNDPLTPTKIYKTLTDGVFWQNISPDSTAIGIGNAKCQFLDANTGFLATDQFLYTTLNGGQDWTTFPLNGYTISLNFLDADHGTIGLFDGTFNYFGGMMTTSDGGASWNTSQLTENGTVIGEVGQLTTNFSYAAPVKWGSYGQHRFFKTSNNGVSWDTVFVPDSLPNSSMSDIHFTDELNGVIGISDFFITHLYYTRDGGLTWIFQDSIPYFSITDLQMTPNTGFIAGEMGKLYKLDIPLFRAGESFATEGRDAAIILYPNPVSPGNTLNWKSESAFTQVSLFDLTGKVVLKQEIRSGERELVLPNLVSGVYLLKFESPEGIKLAKLMIN